MRGNENAEKAYLLYTIDHLTQQVIADKLGLSQALVSKLIIRWRKKLYDEGILERQSKVVVPEPIPELVIPDTIGEFTQKLGYVDKPFHGEWYNYAETEKKFELLAPRTHAKSTCISVNFPLWRIAKNPNIRILLVSNTDAQARRFVRQVRATIERYMPSIIPSNRDNWAQSEFTVTRDKILKEPTVSALGVNGAIISMRADLIILDDVVDRENSVTEDQRDKLYDWLGTTLLPCLEPDGQILVIGTTFGPDDLYARLQRDGWPFRRYDAILDEEEKVALWPERVPFECPVGQRHKAMCCLVNIRKTLGVIRFNAQYRCDPSGYSGEKLKMEWIRDHWYRTLPENLEMVLGVDPAISQKTGADYFAIATVGYSESENKIYAVDFYHAHLTFPEQIAAITQYWSLKRASRIIIESVAYQEALAQGVQGMGLPVVPYKTIRDKVTRILNISPYFENKMIQVKEDQSDFLTEYSQFDGGAHDDLLDAFCLAVTDIVERHSQKMVQHTPLFATARVFKTRTEYMEERFSARPLMALAVKTDIGDIGEPSQGKERVLNLATGRWEWK